MLKLEQEIESGAYDTPMYGAEDEGGILVRGSTMLEPRDFLAKAVVTLAVAGTCTLLLFLIALVYHALK